MRRAVMHVIGAKTVLYVQTMFVLFVNVLTVKMSPNSFQPAGEARIIKADEIYECLACGKQYTAEEMYDHEGVCDKIEEYLKSKSTSK